MTNTAQTPTNRPSELDAIRARVDAQAKKLAPSRGQAAFLPFGKSDALDAHADSRRLLELLDERDAIDAIIEHEQFISASLEATYDTMKARNVKHSSEIDSLRRELTEARELMREWYDGLPTYDLAWLESLKIRVKKFISNN